MLIKSASFLISSTDLRQCPKPEKPEYAFIGRSNVGKSSLINMLVNRKNLAKTSSSPGKTTLINHFVIESSSTESINEQWYLVDLPGLGYAKSSKSSREGWQKMIYNYLSKRRSLMNTFILIDSRHELQKIDAEFINWCGENQLPFTILLTKIDKIKDKELMRNIDSLKKELKVTWEELPQMISTSAISNTGRDEILNFIEETNKVFEKPV